MLVAMVPAVYVHVEMTFVAVALAVVAVMHVAIVLLVQVPVEVVDHSEKLLIISSPGSTGPPTGWARPSSPPCRPWCWGCAPWKRWSMSPPWHGWTGWTRPPWSGSCRCWRPAGWCTRCAAFWPAGWGCGGLRGWICRDIGVRCAASLPYGEGRIPTEHRPVNRRRPPRRAPRWPPCSTS